jgi:hypothetical protein
MKRAAIPFTVRKLVFVGTGKNSGMFMRQGKSSLLTAMSNLGFGDQHGTWRITSKVIDGDVRPFPAI